MKHGGGDPAIDKSSISNVSSDVAQVQVAVFALEVRGQDVFESCWAPIVIALSDPYSGEPFAAESHLRGIGEKWRSEIHDTRDP